MCEKTTDDDDHSKNYNKGLSPHLASPNFEGDITYERTEYDKMSSVQSKNSGNSIEFMSKAVEEQKLKS